MALARAAEGDRRVLEPVTIVIGENQPIPSAAEAIDCPLSFGVLQDSRFPADWPARSLWETCADVELLRSRVARELQWPTTDGGDRWLPLVVTAKGPLYAEAIARDLDTGSFVQPHHLSDRDRQTAYRLAFELLSLLKLPPGVYLVQWGQDAAGQTQFDRLYPFPAAPAIASLAVQTPDLFECHLRGLLSQPLREVAIL
ncbi:MAG: hypothetical protein EA001_09225 [Oscillatoriales cyanobacterium]|nr:MAG: hypothetical protein EA001_09225 [Oscillatoriales cyanobacterium]